MGTPKKFMPPTPILAMDSEPEIPAEELIAAKFGMKSLGMAPCPKCGEQCERFSVFSREQFDCRACIAADKARRVIVQRRLECDALWMEVTPPYMQIPLVKEKLGEYLWPALELNGLEGAGLAGSSGSGKTRVCYWLLKLAAQAGKKPFAVTASKYRQAASSVHDSNPDVRAAAKEILRASRHAQALLLDDIGKGASTPVGDEALFELLNYRRDQQKITFWNANAGSKWILSKHGADYGPPILRRLTDLAGFKGKGTGNLFVEAKSPSS